MHGSVHSGNIIIVPDGSIRLTHVSPLLYTDPIDDTDAIEETVGLVLDEFGERPSAARATAGRVTTVQNAAARVSRPACGARGRARRGTDAGRSARPRRTPDASAGGRRGVVRCAGGRRCRLRRLALRRSAGRRTTAGMAKVARAFGTTGGRAARLPFASGSRAALPPVCSGTQLTGWQPGLPNELRHPLSRSRPRRAAQQSPGHGPQRRRRQHHRRSTEAR